MQNTKTAVLIMNGLKQNMLAKNLRKFECESINILDPL